MDTRKTPIHPLATDAVLSPAETRVAAGYTAGLIGKEIADRCGITHNTVIKHTQNIYNKAGIRRSTNALVAWFLGKNAGIDLREFERMLGAALLLGLLTLQMALDQNDNYVRRQPTRRTETRKGGSRRRNEDDTLNLENL
jgi:DNA-binding CsgD family transcriptional regulator